MSTPTTEPVLERRAADYLASRAVTDDRGWVARRLDRFAGRAEAVRRHPWTRAVVTFLPELRPAWWVARGWLLV
jgi:hypothetical protein